MNIYRDRQVKHLCIFLAFYVAMIFLIGASIFWLQEKRLKGLYLAHDASIVSSLSDHGVSKDIIAMAITNETVNAEGRELLSTLGITKHTATIYYPFLPVFQKDIGAAMLFGSIVLAALLCIGFFAFFQKRERLYRNSIQIVDRFIEGDFSCRIARKEEGTFYRLLSCVEQLSFMLQTQMEAERKSKEFLKKTISDISHQLKTPLSALIMYHDIMSDEPGNKETIRQYLDKTGLALQRMERLILSMLKIARLDTQSIIFEKESCLISDLVDQSIQELTERAAKEGKQIILNGLQDKSVVCDSRWTEEAIGNIVKNGLDHTGKSGEIRITWECSVTMARIFISDNGPGIPPEELHHIFKRFYRGKAATDLAGIGLGLPLAKAIMEGQGGLLSVESSQGEGTTFILSFLTEL